MILKEQKHYTTQPKQRVQSDFKYQSTYATLVNNFSTMVSVTLQIDQHHQILHSPNGAKWK